jgi:hypothetical protein
MHSPWQERYESFFRMEESGTKVMDGAATAAGSGSGV